MSKLKPAVFVIALAICLCAPTVFAAGDANVFLGRRSLSDTAFDQANVEGRPQYGVAVSLEFNWPVAIAMDLLSSSEEATNSPTTEYSFHVATEVETMELDLGVRKFWGERLRPYVGGGLAYIELSASQTMSGDLGDGVQFSLPVVDEDDGSFGYWLNTGFAYLIGKNFNIGVDVRYSDAENTLNPRLADSGVYLESGGFQFGAMLGFHW